MSLEIVLSKSEETLLILLSGRLDGLTVSEFDQHLAKQIDIPQKSVLIDFSNLHYISSAGLRSLLILAKLLQKKKLAFAIFSLPKQIQEIFEISGFNQIISIYADEQQARTMTAE